MNHRGGEIVSRGSLSTAEIWARDKWRHPNEVSAKLAYLSFLFHSESAVHVHDRVVIEPLLTQADDGELPLETMSALPGKREIRIDPAEAFYALASCGVARRSQEQRYVAEVPKGMFALPERITPVLMLAGGNVHDPRHPREYAPYALAVEPVELPNNKVYLYKINWCRRRT